MERNFTLDEINLIISGLEKTYDYIWIDPRIRWVPYAPAGQQSITCTITAMARAANTEGRPCQDFLTFTLLGKFYGLATWNDSSTEDEVQEGFNQAIELAYAIRNEIEDGE